MDSEEQRRALRAAVYRGDGPAVVELFRGVGADDDSLQLASDGVIAAMMQRVDGAAELARKLVLKQAHGAFKWARIGALRCVGWGRACLGLVEECFGVGLACVECH